MCVKVVLFTVICYWAFIAQINAECIIRIPEDPALKPKFFRNYETAATLISDTADLIRLDNNENIIGYCRNQFVNPQARSHTLGSTLTFMCESNKIHIEEGYDWLTDYPFECTPQATLGTCSIQTSPDKTVGPKFYKKLGTRTIQVLPEEGAITIKYDQEITAHCDTKFKSPYHQEPNLQLICIHGHLVALGHPYNAVYSGLECETSKWNLYESATQFPWCPSDMASYLLARPQAHSTSDFEYLAGLCYDFEQMSVKSVYYAVPIRGRPEPPSGLDSFKPLMEIADVDKNFISKKSFVYDNSNMQDLFTFANYINGLIFQYPRLSNDSFAQFDKMLTIDWWSGLKRGNWKLYEQALDEHVDKHMQDYDILAGVSEVVSVPMRNKDCKTNFTLVDLIDSENCRLPLYIWNYVRSLNNASEDVVVIGVNTPFVDFYNEKELLFCKDICDEIDWLKDVRMTFHYHSMGLIICCSVDEVLATKRLDGFALTLKSTPQSFKNSSKESELQEPTLAEAPVMVVTKKPSNVRMDTTTTPTSILLDTIRYSYVGDGDKV